MAAIRPRARQLNAIAAGLAFAVLVAGCVAPPGRPGPHPKPSGTAPSASPGPTGTPGTPTPAPTGTPGTEPANLTWKESKATFSVREGSVDGGVLTFRPSGRSKEVSAEVSADLAPAFAVDVAALTELDSGDWELPVTVTGPVGGAAGYSGTVALKDADGPIGPAASVTVAVTRVDASTIPGGAAAPAESRIVSAAGGQEVVADELVVGVSFDAPDPAGLVRSVAADQGAVILGSIPDARTYQLRFPGVTLADLDAKRAAIAAVGGIDFAVRNEITRKSSAVPNDDAWGDGRADDRWGLERIHAPEAWDVTTGNKDVKVAVIDSDMDRNHGDLDDNVGRSDGRGVSAGGHGTHVAGTICAEGNNGEGLAGVAWRCDLRMFPAGGGTNSAADTATVQERMVAAAKDGARVVNMSLQFVQNSGGRCSTVTPETAGLVADANRVFARALLYAQRADKDVLWVFAAGNDCRDARNSSPASLVDEFPTNVITVASIGRTGALSTFSDFGELVTVAAPGEDVYSTLPRSCLIFGLLCRDNYGRMSGTSMATPHVTGLAELVMSNKPALTAAEVKACIAGGAIKAGRKVPDRTFYEIDAPSAVACEGTVSLPPQVDVVFALDLTGSMGGVLSLAKDQAAEATQGMRTASPSTDFRFAVTSYEDYPGTFDSRPCGSSYHATYGSGGDRPFRLGLPLTSDGDAVESAVRGLTLGSGDDGPESYGRALWEMAQADTGGALGFRPGALKLVVNFGDDVPHDPDVNEGVEPSAQTLGGDTGVDPGRNEKVDCGGDDIDFQGGAIAGLKAAGIRLLQVDSSGGSRIEPYWRLWTSQTGGAYTKLARDDGRTLSEITLELLRAIPRS
jgi:subtilisin family serine protease